MKSLGLFMALVFTFGANAQYMISKERAAQMRNQLRNAAPGSRTVDGFTSIWLAVEDFNEEKFMVKEFPIVGCYGIQYGPQIEQFGQKMMMPNPGCGTNIDYCSSSGVLDMNALSCAKSVVAKWDDGMTKVLEVTINAEGCVFRSADNLKSWSAAVQEAGAKNFDIKKEMIKIDASKAKFE